MTIWPKNLFKAKILTQKFITSYKIDPKIYFPAEKVPSKNGTSRIPIYGIYPPRSTKNSEGFKLAYCNNQVSGPLGP